MFKEPEKVLALLRADSINKKILVLGDVMLDRYYFGEVRRISPEAPVPVVRVQALKDSLGGAANVAHNLARLGYAAALGGICGNDENGKRLCRLLAAKGIDYSGVVTDSRPTVTKLRIIGAHQQMLRLDFEKAGPVNNHTLKYLKLWTLDQLNSGAEGVIISDYAKGVCVPGLCSFVISECRQRDIPVVIDPKGPGWDKYSGATFITPNLQELSEALSAGVANEDAALEKYGREARQKFGVDNLLVTRSEKGMSLINSIHTAHIPARAREVFDVTGAGDTVTAVLAAALAGGLGPVDAAQLANAAAGLVVGKVGTYAVSRNELWTAVYQIMNGSGPERKLCSTEDAVKMAEKWRKQGQKLVFTNGCFDILHAGHVVCLEKARRLGDRLIVGLNTDASVRRIKGPPRPIVPERDRAKLLAALEFVDLVVLFNEDTPLELIRAIKPHILVKGGDYRENDVVGREYAGMVKIIPCEKGYSTSELIKRVIEKHKTADKGGLKH